MAQRKQKKRRWLRTGLCYLLFPIAVWVGALLIWFFWADLSRIFSKPGEKPKAAVKSDAKTDKAESSASQKPAEPALNRSEEKLADEDREKLDAILKRLQERETGNQGS